MFVDFFGTCVLCHLCSLTCLLGNNALKTELQFSDMYCLMAVHVYIDLWRETGEFSSLLSPDVFLIMQHR